MPAGHFCRRYFRWEVDSVVYELQSQYARSMFSKSSAVKGMAISIERTLEEWFLRVLPASLCPPGQMIDYSVLILLCGLFHFNKLPLFFLLFFPGVIWISAISSYSISMFRFSRWRQKASTYAYWLLPIIGSGVFIVSGKATCTISSIQVKGILINSLILCTASSCLFGPRVWLVLCLCAERLVLLQWDFLHCVCAFVTSSDKQAHTVSQQLVWDSILIDYDLITLYFKALVGSCSGTHYRSVWTSRKGFGVLVTNCGRRGFRNHTFDACNEEKLYSHSLVIVLLELLLSCCHLSFDCLFHAFNAL